MHGKQFRRRILWVLLVLGVMMIAAALAPRYGAALRLTAAQSRLPYANAPWQRGLTDEQIIHNPLYSWDSP